MRRARLIGFFFLLMGAAQAQAPAPVETEVLALTTGIEPGAYPVAYRALATYDLSRQPVHGQSPSGAESRSFKDAPGRQMRIHLWYPTPTPGRPVKFEEYAWELARDLEFSWMMTDEKKEQGVRMFLEIFRDRFGNDTLTLEDIKPILRSRMMAARDFNPAKGKFPVVIFPCLNPTVEASFLAEYLASHGFVVASHSIKGTDSNLPELSVRGITTQARDISFVLSEIKKLPYADLDKISLIGAGISSTSCIAALTANRDIKSYISLDGGILGSGEKQYLQQTTYYDPAQLTASMLFFYSGRPGVTPLQADEFKYARRTYIKFPSMSEPYFLNYAAYEKLVPGITGNPYVDLVEGYEWSTELVYAYLVASQNGKTDLDLGYTLSDIPESLAVAYDSKAPLQAVPSLYELKVLFAAGESGDEFQKWYDVIKVENPQPYGTGILAELFQWLGSRRDENFQKREALVKMWLTSIPLSSRGYYAAACLAKAKGDDVSAKANQKKARELLDNDEDIYLDNITRQKIRSTAKLSLTAN